MQPDGLVPARVRPAVPGPRRRVHVQLRRRIPAQHGRAHLHRSALLNLLFDSANTRVGLSGPHEQKSALAAGTRSGRGFCCQENRNRLQLCLRSQSLVSFGNYTVGLLCVYVCVCVLYCVLFVLTSPTMSCCRCTHMLLPYLDSVETSVMHRCQNLYILSAMFTGLMLGWCKSVLSFKTNLKLFSWPD